MKPFALCLMLVSFTAAFSQPKPAKPAFEVAAVRPSDPNPDNTILVGMSQDPSVVRYDNITLRDTIRGAFRVRDFQIVAPDWMANARFQIEGKIPAGVSNDQIPEMLQSLLAERFKLETRREMKETNVYALVVAKDGPKLKPSESKPDSKAMTAMGTDGKPRQLVYFGGSSSDVTVTAPGASLLTFVGVTSRFTQWPLVDMTGIEGLYDFSLRFAPEVSGGLREPPANAPGALDPAPTLADALKQYGLRIEKRKLPLEMLVVTHMDRVPTEN
ncbi:MAG: TIGR03435 family protein [Acidobacteriota bacterium]